MKYAGQGEKRVRNGWLGAVYRNNDAGRLRKGRWPGCWTAFRTDYNTHRNTVYLPELTIKTAIFMPFRHRLVNYNHSSITVLCFELFFMIQLFFDQKFTFLFTFDITRKVIFNQKQATCQEQVHYSYKVTIWLRNVDFRELWKYENVERKSIRRREI